MSEEQYKNLGTAEPDSSQEQAGCNICRDLTFKERVIGFLICLATGFLIEIFGLLALKMKKPQNLKIFGCLFTFGLLILVAGTTFLVGLKRQMSKMFEEKRLVATCVFLGSVILSLIVVFSSDSVPGILLLFLVIFQLGAYAWYSLSFIPFARSAVSGCLRRLVCC